MADDFYSGIYNPDVLSCIANLSNDEVFTPPDVANAMLDLLPQELFASTETTFLDPACKSGVFLREIAKRLLAAHFPGYKEALDAINAKKSAGTALTAAEETYLTEFQAGVDHIFHHQLFGIAITELTSLLSRRGVYCSKFPNGEYSVSHFDDAEGNIRFKRIEHRWKDGKCVFCGASQGQYDRDESLETHAYEWIHTTKPEEIWKMKFDVIISNPPYQLSDGGAQASAIPIYNEFVNNAKKLKPNYICMIIPSRWMTGGRGLVSFRNEMLHDHSIQILHDFADSSDCFKGVDIKGGVCYFMINSHYDGKCTIYRHSKNETSVSKRYLVEKGDKIFVRDNRLISIKNKVCITDDTSFDTIVSSMKPYGLRGDVFKNPNKYNLPPMSDIPQNGYISILGLDNLKRVYRYIPPNYPLPVTNHAINKWKLFITRNWGIGSFDDIPSAPVIAGPGEICTETFIEFGPFGSKKEVQNVYSYLCTKFFRAMVAIRKQDQGASKAVYHYVPIQDFSKPWTDKELYEKYGLTEDEITFIESTIKPMDAGGDLNA